MSQIIRSQKECGYMEEASDICWRLSRREIMWHAVWSLTRYNQQRTDPQSVEGTRRIDRQSGGQTNGDRRLS